jgi:hypothetical protein
VITQTSYIVYIKQPQLPQALSFDLICCFKAQMRYELQMVEATPIYR